MRAAIAAAVVAAVVAASALAAQQQPDLRAGQRVRLDAPVLGRDFEGTILTRTGDSIVVAAIGGAPRVVAAGDLRRASVSMGRSRRLGALKGAGWGAVTCGGLTLAIGLAALEREKDEQWDMSDVATSTWTMASGCGTWGAVIGAFVKSERWRRAAVEPRVGVNAGVALGLAMRLPR